MWYSVTVVTAISSGWVLLTYRVARDPSAGRVAVWRKLKRLGAILIHDSAWVLPSSPRTFEQFQWLAAEIREMGGEAMLWRASLSLDGQDALLVGQFLEQVDAVYAEILTCLQEADADLVALSKRFQQARSLDYFNSALGARVREALLSAGREVQP